MTQTIEEPRDKWTQLGELLPLAAIGVSAIVFGAYITSKYLRQYDRAFAEFIQILEWVASKKGKSIGFVGRWFPSSKTCSSCGHVHKNLEIKDRIWRCGNCLSINDRDKNAAINILKEGQRIAA